MEELKKIISDNKVYYCLECGKCTANCPIAMFNENFSPRRIAGNAIEKQSEEFLEDEMLWSCLTCKMCYQRCPSNVHFTEFIQQVRCLGYSNQIKGHCAHHGMLQSIMRMMTNPDLSQNRLDWIPDNLHTNPESEYLFFVGCLPYFDIYFGEEYSISPLQIARSALKILNYLGIEPQILKDERCCGHDLLYIGDKENFETLAKINSELFAKSGAKTIITVCPECSMTFKHHYGEFISTDIGIKHISEIISENLDKLNLVTTRKKVTFQDPCRLGRYQDIYDEPRNVIKKIAGDDFVEMEKSRNTAVCCGSSNWLHCDTFSKQVQFERLEQAYRTGSELLITACPKCQIHFSCAQNDQARQTPPIELKDLTVFVAERLKK